METITELIGIEVGFWGKQVVPIRFVFDGRRHEVKRVALKFERKDGRKRYMCFAVDTGQMLAELAMDRDDFSWSVTNCVPASLN